MKLCIFIRLEILEGCSCWRAGVEQSWLRGLHGWACPPEIERTSAYYADTVQVLIVKEAVRDG